MPPNESRDGLRNAGDPQDPVLAAVPCSVSIDFPFGVAGGRRLASCDTVGDVACSTFTVKGAWDGR